MNPSQEQVKSGVRSLIIALGSALAGWAVGKRLVTQEQAMLILNNQEIISAVTTFAIALIGWGAAFAGGIWGQFNHTQANTIAVVAAMPDKKKDMVAEVAAMPEVAKVEMMPTQAGEAIAEAIPPMPGAIVTVAPSSRR